MEGATILSVDNESLFRGTLAKFLGTLPGVALVEEAGTLEDAVQKAREILPDLVLIDIRICLDRLTQDLAKIKSAAPRCQMAVLTSLNDPDIICNAVLNGADSYILKNIHPDALLQIVKLLLAGSAVFSPEVTAVLFNKMRFNQPKSARGNCPAVALSPRQREVLQLLERGLSNKEIAAALSVSPNTVKNHVQSVFKKLCVENRTCAVSRALGWGVLDSWPEGEKDS